MLARIKVTRLALVVGLGLSVVACSQYENLKARKLFKDANALYQQQRYKQAAEAYEEALASPNVNDPELLAGYFYMANSYDNLYKPSRQGEPENDSYLQKAVEGYKIAAERIEDPKLKKLSLEYLVASYGPDKLNDPSQAEPIIQRMIQLDPSEPANYFYLARIYEDNGNYEDAEATLLKAREAKPNEPSVYLTLAGYYNRQGDFPKTIEALQQRTAKEPNNPEGYYTIATYYWEKAYRDFRITEAEKRDYVNKGLEAVDKALEIKTDYSEAMVYKNILLRMQANMEKDPARQAALIKQADQLRDKAEELRKAGQAQPAGAAPGQKGN
jgi:tetratricopeptide (TPR) repeat protein